MTTIVVLAVLFAVAVLALAWALAVTSARADERARRAWERRGK